LTDLLAGQVQIYFETSPLIIPQAQAGKLRVLAIAGNNRLNHLPEVPTTGESGFPKLLGGFWSGLVAPPGTPSDIVEALNAAVNEAMRSQEVQTAMERLGATPQLGTPVEFREFISAETTRWTEIIRSAGVKAH
jgi:tripartite-type tricarboxylate transporter receptor subunit TctC